MSSLAVCLRMGLFSLVATVLLAQSNVAIAGEAAPADWGLRLPLTPLQLSLYKPLQVFSPATPVRGFRFNLIYGEQRSVWGVDTGLYNKTTGDVAGVQFGLANSNHDGYGLQAGAINWGHGDFIGIQYGLVNLNEQDESLQVGIRWNGLLGYTPKMWGIDAGVFNMTTLEMRGLQMGLSNANLGDAQGLQVGVANWVSEDFVGVQAGFLNMVAGNSKSLQLGFLNSARSLRGVQIGVLNINEAGQLFPLIAWARGQSSDRVRAR